MLPMMRGQGAPGQRRRLTDLLGFGGAPGGGVRRPGAGLGLGSAGRGLNSGALGAAAANTAAAPASREAPDNGSAMPAPRYTGKGSGASGVRKRLMQLNYYNAERAQEPMWAAIDDLISQANTSRFSPEGRAQFLAPRMQAYDQQERQAQGAALRNQLGRGLDESSYSGNVEATIGSQFGAARAGAINDLYGAEEQRQLQSQALLRDLLMGLQGRSSQQAASVANSITDYRMQQQQLDAMNNPWATFGGILGSAAGMAGGLGWSPFRPTPSNNGTNGRTGST